MVKKYWDIILGTLTGIALSVFAKGNIEQIQLCYSVIILLLISIGLFRIVKQTIDKQKKKKELQQSENNLIYNIVDHQKPVQAISLAQDPTKVGEEAGKKFIKFMEVLKKIMKKIGEFLDKFKGYILTFCLMALTIIEMCGGFINQLAGGVLTINGIEIVPMVTLVLTAVVGILSNGYSKEDAAKIKAVLSKSAVSETIKVEIKKSIKAETEAITNLNKSLKTATHDLDSIESEIEALKNTYSAKQEMYNMIPQLATINDVNEAHNAIVDAEDRKREKEKEIEEIKSLLETHTTKLNALKSQI